MNDVITLAQTLISTESVSGNDTAQRRLISTIIDVATADDLTIDTTISAAGEQPWAVLTGGSRPGQRIAFACHVDTVPVGDASTWSFDPYGADLVAGQLRGRGSVDMKTGLAAAVVAFRVGVANNIPCALILTSDEEIGALGAAAASSAVAAADIGAVIIPEATDDTIHLGHRGALWLAVTVRGRAAHGSTPQLGHNAALDLVSVLSRAQRELPLRSDSFLGTETWNLGVLEAGVAPNIVPDIARAVIDHRIVGEGRHLERWWRDCREVADVETLTRLNAVLTSSDHQWIQSLPAAVASAPVPYFTDASRIRAVLPSVPIVIWGPGRPSAMHAVDEQVDIANVHTILDHYRQAVLSWPLANTGPSTVA